MPGEGTFIWKHDSVTFEGQNMNAESRTGVCEEPQPTLPKPVLLALSKNRMWLQQSTKQIICTDNRPLTSFNLPAYWNSILLAMVIKGTKKRTASFFLFFFWSQLESYNSICWRGKKINSRHLSVSNIWWYVGMLFMLTIFRYHTVRNKASHIAFSTYN